MFLHGSFLFSYLCRSNYNIIEMKTYTIFEKCSASAYYDAVFTEKNVDAEAAYYLLTKRLDKALRREYDYHGFGLSDDYDDTIDDFFLYLYEGNGQQKPFSLLENVHNKHAFFSWVLSTFRNFLLKRVREEEKKKNLFSFSAFEDPQSELLSDETMVMYLATAIAYADQQFTPRNRFVFYRMILTFLDQEMAVPQEEIAKVLGMHPVTYRVSNKRQKERFLKFISEQEAGATLELDEPHCSQRDHIVKGFSQLYNVLLEYYEQAVNELPLSMEIRALRIHYSGNNEWMMHDTPTAYGFRYKTDIHQLYANLKVAWSFGEDR